METLTEKSFLNNPDRTNRNMANASLIAGICGGGLPYLVPMLMGDRLNHYLIDKIGALNANLLLTYISIALAIGGPIAIILGIIALYKGRREKGRVLWKYIATTGIVLGFLCIPLVIFPLLFYLRLVYICGGRGCFL